MKKYEAIVYGWRNIENGKMYIGYHKTADVDDGYIFSTEDEEAHLAWSYGKLERSIIYRGKQSIAITLENYLLKKEQAHKNPMFYNRSVGGGVGCVKDFSNLTESVKKIGEEWIGGKIVRQNSKVDVAVDQEEMQILAQAVKDGIFPVKNEKTSKIFKLPRNQVRFNVIDNEHVSEIADKMRDNPAKARENISPVIIMVREDGTLEIIDGNHTVNAAEQAGWIEIPVIYLNFSEFKNKQANIDWFGYNMNHEEKLKKPNDKNDLKRALINFTNTHPHLDIGSQLFKDSFKHAYGKYWTNKQISQSILSVKDMLETEEEIRKNNFKVYSKREIAQVVKQLEIENPGTAVVSISSATAMNSGVGAMSNKTFGMKTRKAIIVITHSNMNDYRKWETVNRSIVEGGIAFNFTNTDVKLHVLPSFVKTK